MYKTEGVWFTKPNLYCSSIVTTCLFSCIHVCVCVGEGEGRLLAYAFFTFYYVNVYVFEYVIT